MNKNIPLTVKEAVVVGTSILDAEEKREMIEMVIFNCHMKYKTNFYGKIAKALGFGFGERNSDLLRDVFAKHEKDLDFIDFVYSDNGAVDVGMRILLMEIRKELVKLS